MYGFQESKELEGGDFGSFGKNSARVTKVEYNPKGGAGEAIQDALDVWVEVESKEYRKRIFPTSKVYVKGEDGVQMEVTDPSDPAFIKAAKLINAEITDLASAIAGEERTKTALSRSFRDFAEYVKAVEELVKSTPGWNQTEIDVFLEYQFSPRGEYTRTFLQLPRSQKHGRIFSKGTGNDFKQSENSKSLRYISEDGRTHSFVRSEWYMNSAFANQINLQEEESKTAMGSDTSSDW